MECGRHSRPLSRLLERAAFDWLAVRVQDLEVVNAGGLRVLVAPNDLLVPRDLGQLHVVRAGVMAGDDRVSVGSRCTPQASLSGRPGRSSLVTRQTSLPSLFTSMTKCPSVQPISVLPLSSRMAVNGMSGVFTSQTTSPLGVY